jgi:hypothetical protein
VSNEEEAEGFIFRQNPFLCTRQKHARARKRGMFYFVSPPPPPLFSLSLPRPSDSGRQLKHVLSQ